MTGGAIYTAEQFTELRPHINLQDFQEQFEGVLPVEEVEKTLQQTDLWTGAGWDSAKVHARLKNAKITLRENFARWGEVVEMIQMIEKALDRLEGDRLAQAQAMLLRHDKQVVRSVGKCIEYAAMVRVLEGVLEQSKN